MRETRLRLMTSSPSSHTFPTNKAFLATFGDVVNWADRDGWDSILIGTDHRELEPWLVAKLVIERTSHLTPLVAVQPLYMHPFTLAQNIYTLSFLFGRRVNLNYVAGGFPRDLQSFCDSASHGERYERLTEYAGIVKMLLMGQGLTSIAGQHYRVKDLKLAGNVPEHLLPALTISGSSASGVNAARQIGACVMGNLKPSWEYDGNSCDADLEHGVRLGVIVRETSQEAWAVAQRRFPFSPTGAAIREFATQMSDSRWNRELGKDSNVPLGHPYCIQPFKY
jgi:alkanesulfonate monooxygenase